ncbi:MAG: hypothetical protein MJ102_08050 [Clostridia bacterium]|nr:hypothetical protein [Clostridia bacterium]
MKYYEIGGVRFAVDGPEFEESANLALFRKEDCVPDVSLQIEISDHISDDEISGEADRKYKSYNNVNVYQSGDVRIRTVKCEKNDGILWKDICLSGKHKTLWNSAYRSQLGTHEILRILDIPHEMLIRGGTFLHAAYVEYNGKAILFTAPKQTGKSTQARLWEETLGAEVINGDRAVIRRTEKGWYVFGSPYCGTSGICKNRTLPISAIVILRQGQKNIIRHSTKHEAVMSFLGGCTFDVGDEEESRSVSNICRMAFDEIPFYTLECLPDREAVYCLLNELRSESGFQNE